MQRPHTPTPPMHCLTQGRSHVINVSAFELSETALYRSLLEESSKKCFSRFAFRGLARGQHDNAFSQLQIADQADTLAGGFPKMPSTRLLNQWTHRFNPLLGATWLGQRDELGHRPGPERHAPRLYLPGLPAAQRLPLSALTDPT